MVHKKYRNECCGIFYTPSPSGRAHAPRTRSRLPHGDGALKMLRREHSFHAPAGAAPKRGDHLADSAPDPHGLHPYQLYSSCAGDLVDVWAGRDNFLLDKNGRPAFIAGAPPDDFRATGQRWGNPIYDWDRLQSRNFEFWVKRIGYNQKLLEIIRIDHFRAFDTY